MGVQKFRDSTELSSADLTRVFVDRLRRERRKLQLTQAEFAEKCGISLRTYKRIELGGAVSFDAFLRMVIAFERVPALDLVFPADEVKLNSYRNPIDALERVKEKHGIQKS